MALKTISARGQLNAGMAIEVECGNHRLIMDQPKNAAGQDLVAMTQKLSDAQGGFTGVLARDDKVKQRMKPRRQPKTAWWHACRHLYSY